MSRVFANDLGDQGSTPGRVIPKIQKIVLDASLLNTQHYKVKWSNLGQRSNAIPKPRCSSYWKGSLQIALNYGLPIIYQNPPHGQMGYKVNKRSLTGLNSEFSFFRTGCHIQVKEPYLHYYLSIAGGRIVGFIPFQRVLALGEMQIASSRSWTHFAVFISYHGKHYHTSASILFHITHHLIQINSKNSVDLHQIDDQKFWKTENKSERHNVL